MNKQKPLALLMATIAIFMLAIACGSSDNTTTTPNQGVTAQPQTEPAQPPVKEPATGPTKTTQPTAPSTPDPAQTREEPTPAPWPTPLPTRTVPPTPRNPEQQTATAAAPPPTQPAHATQTPQPPQETEVLPNYDGSSPLIHAYVDLPLLLFAREEGASITIPIKGLTQDGQLVSILNPAKWGITFTILNTNSKNTIDEHGKYKVLDNNSFETLRFNLRDRNFYITVNHPPKDRIQPPVTERHQRADGTLICHVDYGYKQTDLNWIFLRFSDPEAVPRLEELALRTGAKPHGQYYYDGNYREGSSEDYQSLYLLEYSPETCPTLQDTLNAVKEWAQTPRIEGIWTLDPQNEALHRIRMDTR